MYIQTYFFLYSKDKKWLLHPDMTYGQKRYMNHIARTYDVTMMKQLKQAQYIQLIYREQQRGTLWFTHYRLSPSVTEFYCS